MEEGRATADSGACVHWVLDSLPHLQQAAPTDVHGLYILHSKSTHWLQDDLLLLIDYKMIYPILLACTCSDCE